MKLWLAKRGRGFIPTDQVSEETHARMADGECALFKIIRVRSVPWHKKYFGICRDIGQNQDPPRSENSIDYELRIRAGHFTVFFVDDVPCRSPDRIAFEELTADEWAKLWPSLEQAIIETFGHEYLGESQRTGTW